MRPLIFLSWVLIIFLATGCKEGSILQTEPSDDPSFPIVTEVTEPPLQMKFHSTHYNDSGVSIQFIAEHIDKSTISAEDYQFQWPKYIMDDDGIMYEVKKADISHHILNGEKELEDHQLAVTLGITPAPSSNRTPSLLHVPIYTVPRLFENGYPFQLTDENRTHAEVSDIMIDSIKVDGETLTFSLSDGLQDQAGRNSAYLFSQIQDNQHVYPLFSNIQSDNGELHVELEFAQAITYPARFSVERTESNIPKWRFSFVVPLKKDDDTYFR